jgi:large subunit ribosomal protein L15
MQTHEIRREHAQKKSKLVGRGGTRGKTSGHGGKGQTARAGHRVRPAMRDIIKKLPKLRGHGKNRSKSVFDRGPEAVVNVSALNIFTVGDVVNPASLLAKGLIPRVVGKFPKVKILGTGEITVKVSVEGCTISDSAKAKIEKAGGSFTEIPLVQHSVDQAKMSADKKAAQAEKKAAKGGKKK